MFWKKNVFSYVLWLFLAAVSLGGLFGLITCMTSTYQSSMYVSLLALVGIFAVAYALMFLVRYIINERLSQVKLSGGLLTALEMSGFLLCLGLGIFLRYLELPRITGDARALLSASVNGQNILFPRFHGASFLYLEILKKVCTFFGTDMLVCVLFQECLLLLSGILLYVSVRRVAGRFPAFLTFLVGFCASYIRKAIMVLSPTVLILLILSVLFFILSGLVKRQRDADFLLFYPVGILIGICGYLDCIGFLPVLFLICLLFENDEDEGEGESVKEKMLLLVGFLVMVVLGFIGCVFVDVLMSSSITERILVSYGYANSSGFSSAIDLTFRCGFVTELTVLFLTVLFAVLGFFMDKEKVRITPWALIVLGILLMQALGFSYSTIDMNVYLMVFGAALGGVGISSFWKFDRKQTGQLKYITEASELGSLSDWTPDLMEKSNVVFGNQDHVPSGDSGVETVEKIEYIENPLPGPRKHVAKSMEYDIEVPDDDDFDI